MAQIDPFLYIVLDDSYGNAGTIDRYAPVREIYDGTVKSVRDIVSHIFIVTRKAIPDDGGMGSIRIEWDIIQVSFDDLTFELNYDSGIEALSNDPINVGRYDYTLTTTYVRNIPGDPYNGTYRGYFTTNYFGSPPAGTPSPDSDLLSDPLFTTDTGLQRPESHKNVYKFLIIEPAPLTIIFTEEELAYTGNTVSPAYVTSPENIAVRLAYSGDGLLSPLGPPIGVGSYSVTATSLDFNYVGSQTASFIVRPLTTTEADTAAKEYQEKVDLYEVSTEQTGVSISAEATSTSALVSTSPFASSSQKVSKTEFIKSGILTMLENSEIQGLDKVKTLAECAQNLPQKLMLFAAAKIAQLVLSYVPGLGILKLLTSIMQLIEQVKKIMALIEFIKDNPWGFLNAVLEASGAYAKLGSLANEKLEELKAAFPNTSAAVGDVAGFVKDVANGLVDICNNVDINGNPIATLIKADNTRVPEVVSGFNPPTSRQPIEEKARYDLFQLRLRDALYKDSEKMDAMNAAGNITGVQEYVSMLTAVHELAYNYHDRIASTGYGTGLIDSDGPDSPIGFGGKLNSAYTILGDATSILSSVYPQNTTETPATVTSTSGGKKKTAFSIDSLNSGLGAVANTISGVTAGLNSVTSFMSGETGFSLKAFKNEFNYAAKETLRKNPFWSKETISEYNKRVNRIKFEMETNAEAIRNNPANASAASAGQGLSSGASTGGIFKGSPLAGSLSSWTGGKWMS